MMSGRQKEFESVNTDIKQNRRWMNLTHLKLFNIFRFDNNEMHSW